MRSPLPATTLTLAFWLAIAFAGTGWGGGPADPSSLLRLVPADVGATLAVEGLRENARVVLESPLYRRLGRLPAIEAWRRSGRFQGLDQARRQVESLLGEKISRLRDDLLGDAVVLAIRFPEPPRQEESRGLLLIRPRDPRLLKRLVDGINAAQVKKGEIRRVIERRRGGKSYWVRQYALPASRPPEFYATLPDSTFAMSNSESMITGVLTRSEGARDGLTDSPAFRGLPPAPAGPALARLFVNPRALEAMMPAAPRSGKPGDEAVLALVGEYLQALDFVAAALVWRDGLILQTDESFRKEEVPAWLRRWSASKSSPPRLDRIPGDALAVAALNLDPFAVDSILRALFTTADRAKLENLLLLIRGILMGKDLKGEIYPGVGPGTLAFLAASPGSGDLSLTAILEWKDAGVAAAIDNGLRTLLAAYALDAKHGDGRLRLDSRESATSPPMRSLVPASPFAYAVAPDRLVISKSLASLEHAMAARASDRRGFGPLRTLYFPGVESFFAADLEAIHTFAIEHREGIARGLAAKNRVAETDAARDLDQALALLGLFRAGFFTSAIAPEARSIHRSLGLIGRPDTPDPSP